MTVKFSKKELDRLKTAHPDLQKLMLRLASTTTIPFAILECARSPAQQRINIKKGVSWTMNSRHIPSNNKCCRCACAVDIAPTVNGKVSWAWPLYHKLAPLVKKAAKEVGVPVEWGGDWKRNQDGPHWQLPWKQYP